MNLPTRLHSHASRIASGVRVLFARMHGVRLGPRCVLSSGVQLNPTFSPSRRGKIILGTACVLDYGATLHPYGGSILLGDGVFLGPHVVIYGNGGVEIGAETLVAMHCRILSSEHPIPDLGISIRSQADILKPTRIGRDVWLGAGVTILGGVTIGDGCVVGAGAVVTKDLPPGSIALGIPARITGARHRPE